MCCRHFFEIYIDIWYRYKDNQQQLSCCLFRYSLTSDIYTVDIAIGRSQHSNNSSYRVNMN